MSFWGTLAAAVAGPAISTIGNIIGSNKGAEATASATQAANEANRDISKEQMAFQERMSSTAIQRAKADLQAAGFNPMLAAGAGASSPSGSAPTMNPVVHSGSAEGWKAAAKGLSDMSGTALQAAQIHKQFETADANIAATKASQIASLAQADNSIASAEATRKNLPVIEGKATSSPAEAKARIIEASTAAYEARAKREESRLKEDKAKFDRKAVVVDGVSSRIINLIGGISDALSVKNLMESATRANENHTMKKETHLRNQGYKGTRVK